MLKKLIFILCICLTVSGCGSAKPAPAEKFTTQVFAMDTVMDLAVYGSDGSVLEEASRLITRLDQTLSATGAGSEIRRLNETGSAVLSPDTAELLERALEFCRETQGALDLSIYPVVKAWGFTTDHHRIPPDEELQQLLTHVDYEAIALSDGNAVTLPAGMEIDLGSVGKGYTGDRVTALFREKGITSALLNLGGNVQALGSKPDGSPWKVGIQDPSGAGYLGVLSMADEAVITSGGYERYFEGPDGEIYWHIIDPATGKPARSGLISATAVGKEGIWCDALSTSLFIMGEEKAAAFWQSHQDFQMILVSGDGRVLITPDLADRFYLVEGSPYTLQVIGHD